MRIEHIDPNGGPIKRWKLEGWFYRSVRFGDLNYDTDDFVTIEMTLGYDYAILETGLNNMEDAAKLSGLKTGVAGDAADKSWLPEPIDRTGCGTILTPGPNRGTAKCPGT